MLRSSSMLLFFFFNDTATTEIYTLSLHDALPISWRTSIRYCRGLKRAYNCLATSPAAGSSSISSTGKTTLRQTDRKSTRLNSSHGYISYAVFCLKKKKTRQHPDYSQRCLTPPRPG